MASTITPFSRLNLIAVFVFLLISGYKVNAQQPGSQDPDFNPVIYGNGANNIVNAISNQVNGKFVIGGRFTEYNGVPRHCVARINADGSVDNTFAPPALGITITPSILATAIQPDEKVLIGGTFTLVNNQPGDRIVRFNSDGSVDTSFVTGSGPGAGGSNITISTIVVQPDGKILAGGSFNLFNGIPTRGMVRLNTDGTLDPTFTPGHTIFGTGGGVGAGTAYVRSIALQADGKIVVAGIFSEIHGLPYKGVARLNPDGSLDATFAPPVSGNVNANSVAIQPDEKIVVCGGMISYNGTPVKDVIRLNPDGSLDPSFSIGTGAGGPIASIVSVAVQPNGKIIIGGGFDSFDGVVQQNLARLNTNGSLDTTFVPTPSVINDPPAGITTVWDIRVQSDNKILVGGHIAPNNGLGRQHLVRFNSDGAMDLNFNPRPGANDLVRVTAVQSDDKILISGSFTAYNGVPRNRIARLNADGTIDLSFDAGTGLDASASAIAIQPDAKIIVAGSFYTCNGAPHKGIVRLNSDGSVDPTFNTGTGINFQNDGEEITLLLQPDGKIVIGGRFIDYNGTGRVGVARLNSDGSLDYSFDPGAGFTHTSGNPGFPRSIALQPDGKLIVGGFFSFFNSAVCQGLARLNPDGSLDTSFITGTVINTFSGEFVTAVALQPDNKIIIGGWFFTYNGTPSPSVVRLHLNGSIDNSFTAPATLGGITGLKILPSGKILFARNASPFVNIVGKLNPDGSTDSSFSGNPNLNGGANGFDLQSDAKIIVVGEFTSVNGVGRNGVSRIFNDTTGILTGTSLPAEICAGAAMNVPFTAQGTYASGNIFSAQLSDASGAFTNAVSIGSSTSTGSGVITATIPSNTAFGTGYRIRVVASAPITMGTDNYSNISIGIPQPSATALPDSLAPGQLLTLFIPNPDTSLTYNWSGSDLNQTTGDTVTANPNATGNTTYTVVASNGTCSDTAVVTVVVDQTLLIQTTGWNWAVNNGNGNGMLLPTNNPADDVNKPMLSGGEEGISIAADAAGNTTTLGRFTGTATFGMVSLSSSGPEDLVLLRMDNAGDVLWAEKAGSATTEQGRGVTLDAAGNSYLTGSFSGTATFGTNSLSSTGTESTFLASYSATGTLNWAVAAGGQQVTLAQSLATDAAGNSTLVGSFIGSATFGSVNLPNSAISDVFVARYNAQGTVVWAKSFGGTGTDGGYSVTLDEQGNTYFSGVCEGNITFGTVMLTGGAGYHKFLCKLDAAGNVLWAKLTGSATSADQADKLAYTHSQLYAAGTFSGTATFGNTTLTSQGGTDILVTDYLPNGDLLWAKRAGGTGDDVLNGIATDAQGLCYLTGSYSGSAGFGSHRLSSIGSSDVFVASFDMGGNALFARKAGGIGADAGNALAVDAQGNCYTTGYFSGRAFFGSQELNSLGQQDMFVARLGHIATTGAAESLSAKGAIVVYPNPFSNSFTVTLQVAAQGQVHVTLHDLLGRQLYASGYSLNAGQVELLIKPSANLAQGVYLLQIRQGDEVQNTRLIKQ